MFASQFLRVSGRVLLSLTILSIGLQAAELGKGKGKKKGPRVAEASAEGELAISKFKLPPGFKAELFAAEPRLANPVCFTIDEQGRFYVAETFRHTDGALDVRKYMSWLDDELANRTMDEHREKITRRIKDAPDMTRESERVHLIEDRDGDGKADFDSIFAEGFNSELHGIGAGLLARKGDVYYSCIPNLYLLRDEDGDGKAEVRKELQTGYGVRFAFIGHDLHGLRMGPDGKLYFSIGDRGFSVKQGDRTIAFPEGGAVLRCNLDGTDLEIFCYGLRNPQELVFDQYGNLWTGENNSDGGDQARWAYLVEGGDTGWRIGYQYITQPNNRGPWNSEKMWHPENSEQPAYIIPPIANLGNGPAGLTYYPGVGMPSEYDGNFFLCDFKGTSTRSLIHTFTVEPKGASFGLTNRRDFMNDILCTDVEFGPDSNLYVSDWTEGWDKPGKGRIYRVAQTNETKDPLVAETKRLIGEGFEKRDDKELIRLLAHKDMRVRQESQFELASRGSKSLEALVKVAQDSTNQLARIHAIWGVGQIIASQRSASKSFEEIQEKMMLMLSDKDPEIRAQIAKFYGDARFGKAVPELINMVQNVKEPRGQFFAAMALGKIKDKAAVGPIIEMLRANNDASAFLRHAGTMGLLGLGDFEAIKTAARDESPAVRMAALLAMRRLQHPDIAMFLSDRQQKLVVEAARAISDLPIVEALPHLASVIDRPHYEDALFRRVLNANVRVGRDANALALAQFVTRPDAPAALRVEALEILKNWEKPSNRDRVTGLWRPVTQRDSAVAVSAMRPHLFELLKSGPPEVKLAAVQFAQHYAIQDVAPVLHELVSDENGNADVRVASLQTLAIFGDSKFNEALNLAAKSKEENVRKEAVALQAKLNPEDATAPLLAVLKDGSNGEKQNAFAALGTLKDPSADNILLEWLDKLIAGNVAAELHLELIEAASKRSADSVKQKLAQYQSLRGNDSLGGFRETLAGGNAEEGRKIFFERVEASCVRCHKIKGEGGEAGPILDGIGSRVARDYLLASIVDPNREIAPGFESVTLHLKDGRSFVGTLKKEDANEIILNSPEDGPVTIKTKDVAKRERGLSGMPPELAKVLSKKDLRNVIEFLATQK